MDNKIKKFKARYIFCINNRYIVIKGYIIMSPYEESPRYYIYGANNLTSLDKDKRDLLINKGVSSLDVLKNITSSFCFCIVEEEARNYIKNKYVQFQKIEETNTIHISLEPWMIEQLKSITEERTKEHLKLIDGLSKQDLAGVIQPNLSSLISEIVLSYLLKEEHYD